MNLIISSEFDSLFGTFQQNNIKFEVKGGSLTIFSIQNVASNETQELIRGSNCQEEWPIVFLKTKATINSVNKGKT